MIYLSKGKIGKHLTVITNLVTLKHVKYIKPYSCIMKTPKTICKAPLTMHGCNYSL